mmetsp:Transcript_20036/g.46653  ORF Transcript_20036/g.46653 Transcript_20036/m.46653 type:complete len:86 (+) Transcript_20036:84-341(+)
MPQEELGKPAKLAHKRNHKQDRHLCLQEVGAFILCHKDMQTSCSAQTLGMMISCCSQREPSDCVEIDLSMLHAGMDCCTWQWATW